MSRLTWGWTSRFQACLSMRLFVGFPKWPLPNSSECPFHVAAGSPRVTDPGGKAGRNSGEDKPNREATVFYNLVLEVTSHHFHCFPLVTRPSSGPLMVGLYEVWCCTRRQDHGGGSSWQPPLLRHRRRPCSFLYTEGIKAGQIRTGSSGKSQRVRMNISQKEVVRWKQKGERLPRMNI